MPSYVRYLLKVEFCGGISFARSEPIFEKYLLNYSALSHGL